MQWFIKPTVAGKGKNQAVCPTHAKKTERRGEEDGAKHAGNMTAGEDAGETNQGGDSQSQWRGKTRRETEPNMTGSTDKKEANTEKNPEHRRRHDSLQHF